MQNSANFTADGRLSTKARRGEECRKHFSSAPETYRSNSTKDELCAEYVQSFCEQFSSLYPKRPIPYMYADNEYGVRKLVSCSVRPTQLPFPELYDMYGCASFLASYILYEPLEPPSEPPKVLFSPTETLNSHTGDSFDIAMVLCSFLIGAGYDAYVVYGNAPKFVAMRDQRSTECPLLTPSTTTTTTTKKMNTPKATPGVTIEDDSEPTGVHEYKVIDNALKTSKFLAAQEEAKNNSVNDDFQLWVSNADTQGQHTPPTSSDDDDDIKRCHAFVLVRAGRRDVKENVFLEPATGRPYTTQSVPLSNIAAAWNANNYWVNLQNKSKTAEMTFDLSDGKNWEFLFITDGVTSKTEDGNEEDAGEIEEKDEGDSPPGYEVSRAFDCPKTWVSPLVMDRPRYALRFPPTGKRSVAYYCAKANFYASGINDQSMTMNIVQYLDVECTIVKEIHEWFENRADKLYSVCVMH